MWFDSASEIAEIAAKTGSAIFVMPPETTLKISGAITIKPEEKSVITIEQIRQIGAKTDLKQTKDQFIIIRPADKLSLSAANAFLKNLEEPGEHIHYILITDSPSKLLPTILSRSALYFFSQTNHFSLDITASEADKKLAKELITAKPTELIEIAESLAKKKPARDYTLGALKLAIEILYKSYFITHKDIFLKKLPKFLTAYDNIAKNGHIKLQIVANLC